MNLKQECRNTGVLTLRALRSFFRDRGSVIASLLSVLIVLLLYVTMLRSSFISELGSHPDVSALVDAWLIGGLMSLISISSSVAAMGLIVRDRSMGILDDLKTSPVSSMSITAGYVLSAFIIGIVLSFSFLLITATYMFAMGFGFSALAIGRSIALMVPSVFSSCAMMFLFASLLKTKASFNGFAMLVNVLIGFITGTFIPIGYFSGGVQSFFNLFPVNHSAAMYRDILGTPALNRAFGSTGEIQEYRDLLGFDIYIGDYMATPEFGIIYLILSGVLFFVLTAVIMRKGR